MANDVLDRLLSPIGIDEFADRYWQRAPLHIPGPADKFAELFDRAAFDRAVSGAAETGIMLRASFDSVKNDKGAGLHVPIGPEQIPEYLSAGATVCADPVDRGDPALARFAQDVATALGLCGKVSVKAYVSSDTFGFNTHFDHGIVTTLQIAGTKVWRISSEPAVAHPRHNALLGTNGQARYAGAAASELEPWEAIPDTDPDSFREVTLTAGDVLCLPAGVWHSAKAVGGSLALNLSFDPLGMSDFFLGTLGRMLRSDPAWRAGLPVGAVANDATALPDTVRVALEDRRDALVAELRTLDAGTGPFAEGWRRAIGMTGALRPAELPFAELSEGLGKDAGPPAPGRKPAEAPPTTKGSGKASDQTAAQGFDGTLTITLNVRDLSKSIEWYVRILGCEIVRELRAFNWCELATPVADARIGLFETPGDEAAGQTTLSFGVDDLDAERARLDARGAIFDGPPETIPGFVSLVRLRDPDGNVLMISESLTD